MNKSILGDCRDVMLQLKEAGIKVQTCITSPPYYGLRDYGTGTWVGGDENCSHKRDSKHSDSTITGHKNPDLVVGDAIYKDVCPRCSAVREDRQLGLEATPQEYVQNMVEVFSHLWDILEDGGTLWLNLGDSYSAGGRGGGEENSIQQGNKGAVTGKVFSAWKVEGFRNKNLLGIPWRVAMALQDFGWNLRQDIIWHKPNPMPESVTDRCTKAHEYVFLLTKSERYYYDYKAISVKSQWADKDKRFINGPSTGGAKGSSGQYAINKGGAYSPDGLANKKSVWTINTRSTSEAHFAVMPEELVEPCILAGSKVGDIVFDPFMGSGTVGRVAQALGRKWLGAELNPEYMKIQDNRTAQQSLELI